MIISEITCLDIKILDLFMYIIFSTFSQNIDFILSQRTICGIVRLWADRLTKSSNGLRSIIVAHDMNTVCLLRRYQNDLILQFGFVKKINTENVTFLDLPDNFHSLYDLSFKDGLIKIIKNLFQLRKRNG